MDGLKQLEIEQHCRNLVLAMARHGDARELEQAAALFVEDGTWVRGGRVWTGRAEIVESYSRLPANRVGRHLDGGTLMTVDDEDHAHGVTYYVFFHHDKQTDEVPLPMPIEVPLSVGEWHDSFVRTAEGWRLATRETIRVFERAATAAP